jgi:hypothetical protein
LAHFLSEKEHSTAEVGDNSFSTSLRLPELFGKKVNETGGRDLGEVDVCRG